MCFIFKKTILNKLMNIPRGRHGMTGLNHHDRTYDNGYYSSFHPLDQGENMHNFPGAEVLKIDQPSKVVLSTREHYLMIDSKDLVAAEDAKQTPTDTTPAIFFNNIVKVKFNQNLRYIQLLECIFAIFPNSFIALSAFLPDFADTASGYSGETLENTPVSAFGTYTGVQAAPANIRAAIVGLGASLGDFYGDGSSRVVTVGNLNDVLNGTIIGATVVPLPAGAAQDFREFFGKYIDYLRTQFVDQSILVSLFETDRRILSENSNIERSFINFPYQKLNNPQYANTNDLFSPTATYYRKIFNPPLTNLDQLLLEFFTYDGQPIILDEVLQIDPTTNKTRESFSFIFKAIEFVYADPEIYAPLTTMPIITPQVQHMLNRFPRSDVGEFANQEELEALAANRYRGF